jgi:hypothetical protein
VKGLARGCALVGAGHARRGCNCLPCVARIVLFKQTPARVCAWGCLVVGLMGVTPDAAVVMWRPEIQALNGQPKGGQM